MNPEEYKPVIADVLNKLKVPKANKEDMAQECYLELLEKQELLDAARDRKGYAASLCHNKIIDIWRAEGRKIPTESLNDPRIFHKASKIKAPEGLTDEQMEEALTKLSPEEYSVIHRLYVEGYSRVETAVCLGIHPNSVDYRRDSGIAKMKKYFGVE